jgi:hypothetical protein
LADRANSKPIELNCFNTFQTYNLPQRVKAAVSASHVRADPADPEGTVCSYLGAVYKNLDKQGALSILDDASGVKRILKQLTEKLSPPVFKSAVADSFDLRAEEERTVWKKAVAKVAMIARDTCIAWPTSQSLKRPMEDGNILPDSSGTKMSVEGAASGVSKKSRRERREEKKGGVTPKSNERKGVQQKSTHQESKVEVDLLCLFWK